MLPPQWAAGGRSYSSWVGRGAGGVDGEVAATYTTAAAVSSSSGAVGGCGADGAGTKGG